MRVEARDLRRFLRLVLAALAAAAILSAQPARSAELDAADFLDDLSRRGVQELTEPGLSVAEQERRFRVLIDESFDIPAIGRFVLGRHWHGASQAEQHEFLELFKDLLVRRFLPLFGKYSGEVLAAGTARPFGDRPDLVSVASRILRPQAEAIQVDWRMRRLEAGGYKILDIVAEGVSIAVTLRAEYGSVLKQAGGDVGKLNELLRDKIAGR